MNRKIVIPDTWLGEPIDGAMHRALHPEKPNGGKPKGGKPRGKPTPMDIDNPENWMILEGRDHSGYKYDDLLVCMHRLGYNPDVQKAAESLGFEVNDTSEESQGRKYIGNINWQQALSLNATLGNQTLTPRQGLDLLIDLKSAIGKTKPKKLYDARGKEIDATRLKAFHNEILKKRDPWRGEWLDARFTSQGPVLTIAYGHDLVNGVLTPSQTEPLGTYLDENGYMDIRTATKHGMASALSKQETLYFWAPLDGKVARFNADSDWAGLGCVGDPASRYRGLGVRPVRAKN